MITRRGDGSSTAPVSVPVPSATIFPNQFLAIIISHLYLFSFHFTILYGVENKKKIMKGKKKINLHHHLATVFYDSNLFIIIYIFFLFLYSIPVKII